MLPYVHDYNEYFNKNVITEEMMQMGREFLDHFPFNYEKVYRHNFDKVLSWTTIGGAGHAWALSIDGVYQKTLAAINHAFNIWKVRYKITDTYEEGKGDFIKDLAPDYIFLHYGYRPIIRETNYWKTPEDVEVAVNNQVYPPGSWLSFWFWWAGIFKKIKGL